MARYMIRYSIRYMVRAIRSLVLEWRTRTCRRLFDVAIRNVCAPCGPEMRSASLEKRANASELNSAEEDLETGSASADEISSVQRFRNHPTA
jgi:hypothetical protein